MPTLFTPLQARYSLPSGVATILRTTPPPDGIGVGVEKVRIFESKPMIRLGVLPVSTLCLVIIPSAFEINKIKI